jgi:hypothetical protein
MRVSKEVIIVAAILLISGISTAQAELSQTSVNQFGRWIGYGWSEGYHTYDECPPCRRRAALTPSYLNWQPLFDHAPIKQAPPREQLPQVSPVPQQQTKAAPGQRPERRLIRPSQQALPLPAARLKPIPRTPVLRRLPPVAANEITPVESAIASEAEEVPAEVLPTSGIRIISPPASTGSYPLSR